MINTTIYKSVRKGICLFTLCSASLCVSAQVQDSIPVGNQFYINKREVANSVSQTTFKELERVNSINPANSLYGLLTGLNIMQNGGFAGERAPDMLIRGKSSLVDNSILILVDGFERELNEISTMEIASIQVLKDAGATAIYGQRGANGVLLITTKRGTKKDMEVDISFGMGITSAFRLPEMLSAGDYARSVNEALYYDGLSQRYSDNEIAAFDAGTTTSPYANVDWMDEVLADYGTTANLNVGFDGGGNKVAYYVGLNYQGENGIFDHGDFNDGYSVQSAYDRLNFRSNLDISVTPTTTLRLNVGGNITQKNGAGTSEDNIFLAMYETPSAAMPVKTESGIWGGTQTFSDNPMALLTSTGSSEVFSRSLNTDATLTQDLGMIVKGLDASVSYAYDNRSIYNDGYTQSYAYESVVPTMETDGTISDIQYISYGEDTPLASYSNFGGQQRLDAFRVKLNYDSSWEESSISAYIMYQQDKMVKDDQYNTYLNQNLAGTLHFVNRERYIADVTLSYSGTNWLPVGDQFNLYPALSLGWVLSEESYLSDIKGIDFLKVRASVGLSGNSLITKNTEDAAYGTGGGYYFQESNNSFSGKEEEQIATTNPKTEVATVVNGGLDFSFWNKLSGSIDAFYEKRSDILVSSDGVTSGVIGVTPSYTPIGEVENRGVEVTLNWDDKIGDLKYNIEAQTSFSKNKIIEKGEEYREYDYMKRTGRSIGETFGYETEGFFSDQADIDGWHQQKFSVVSPGDVKYRDQNGDKIIDELDALSLGGGAVPEMYYSLKLGVEYRGFGFNTLFQGATKSNVMLSTEDIFTPLKDNGNISEFAAERWTEQTKATAKLPRLSTLENLNNYQNNDIYFVDSSYLKLRNLEVYYKFPKAVASKLYLENLTISATGNNLFSIDNIDIVDPEDISRSYPTLSSYSLMIKFDF